MKKQAIFKRITAIFSSLIMLFMTSCSTETQNGETATGDDETVVYGEYFETSQNVSKTETVYANLNSYGAPDKITVSDWLHADRSEIYVADTTTLKDFTVTRGYASSTENNGNVTWQMASSDVYYEGTTDATLPIGVDIKYYLDGAEISEEDLAGKSGEFRMDVTMTNRVTSQVEINGQTVTMYAPFIAAGGMILPYENFSNIEVTGGMSIGAGTYEMVVLAGAPGAESSLNLSGLDISGFENLSLEESFTITATVTNFSMGDGYFIFAPLSSVNLDIALPETLGDVQDVLTQLQDFTQLMNQIDPNSVLQKFITDGESLNEMMDIMDKSLTVYSENKKMLNAMTELLTKENIETLSAFLESLNGSDMESLVGVLSNVSSLQGTIDSLLQLSTGLEDVMPILEAFSAALEDPEVAASMEKLPQTLATLEELMAWLNENEEMLDIMVELMATEDMQLMMSTFDAILSENGEDISNLDLSALSGSAEDLVLRMRAWMSIDYSIYTSAPDYMTTSCTFICKTPPIG
ncbi:MAG: hypothetical protein IJZ35_05005 [Clostridia bacterium]|nr:hypothetical protein [Clostridia bacterium]